MLGGVAQRTELLSLVSRPVLEQAVRAGTVVRVARGRYALPTDEPTQVATQRLAGTAILVSAAAHWGWRRMWEPRAPQVAVPVGRKVRPDRRAGVDLRWRNIPREDVTDGWVISPVRTLMDCAVLLPFAEALAITDSALRCGDVRREQLLQQVATFDAQLRPRVHRVFWCADGAAANPFESALRAAALDVPGLDVQCQLRIDDSDGFVGRVDLADVHLRIVIEGESFEFHGEREMLDRDCQRYSRLTADGWLVLRFSWTHVMTKPDWVRSLIARTVATQRRCTCGSRLAGGL
jgi:very-short-patch-repair endonuclease